MAVGSWLFWCVTGEQGDLTQVLPFLRTRPNFTFIPTSLGALLLNMQHKRLMGITRPHPLTRNGLGN